MTRPVHGAYIEEGVDDNGERYFVATCAETLTVCDSFGFPCEQLKVSEDDAIANALRYLGWRDIHDMEIGGEHFCDADHVHVAEIEVCPVNPDGHVSYRLTVEEVESLARQRFMNACWDDGYKAALLYERARVRKAQSPALRNLRVLYAPECDCDAGLWAGRRHKAGCERGDFYEQLRWLRAATKDPR